MFSKLFVALASAGVAASIPTGPVLVGHPAPYDETPKASLILPLVFVVEKNRDYFYANFERFMLICKQFTALCL